MIVVVESWNRDFVVFDISCVVFVVVFFYGGGSGWEVYDSC